MHANLFLYLLFVLLICVFHQQYSTVHATNTCFGYSAVDIYSVCGGHGFCQISGSCYCTDSTSSSSLYSNGASTLNEQNSKYSSNNIFEVRQQNDGNLVLYRSGTPYWSSDTYQQGSGAYSLVLSSDGTLQIKGSGGGSVIKTLSGSCGGGTSPFTLVMQNDGNLVLYGAQKEVCWSSNSNQQGYSLTYIWAGDECNQYLCYGSVGSSACSGHGSCVGRDSCSCNGGYTGSQCSTYYCNGVLSSQTGTVCSGHGTCTQPETCSCNGGYSGTYCNSYTCNGLTPSDPNVCNGFGTCASPETCTNCQAGRYGSLCQYYDCGGIRFDQGNVCSSRGSCGSSNNCTCPEPYFGNNCESYTCNGVINNSSMVCSGHGTCSSPENCTCQEGYFGNDCEWFECSGVLKNETSVCSGFGNCTAFDTCQCDTQHTGTSCEINICNGVLSNSPSICSAHGQCNSFNNCTCDENYSGQNCEIYDCYGASKNSSTVCSGRGTCSAYNNCTCQVPFYGSDCGLYNCFGVEHLNSSTCSSHGSCDSPNNCTCQPGYYGKNCEIHNCYGILFNSSSVCSTHGQCSSPNNCQCEAGYYGLDCSEHDCFGVNKNSSNVCFKHGTCLSPNNCSCQVGYFSFDCSNHECFGYLFNDTNVCSGHGACLVPSNCTCQAGYYGITCEMHNCYGTLFNSSSVCSTHGQCSSPNNCQCEAGYYGKECSEHDCFGIHKNSSNVCYNHGSCLRPNNCSCQEGYYGFDCSNHNCYGILFNETNVCSGHGSCYVPENCTCKAGYYGITCEMHNCFDTLFNETSVCSGKGQCVTPNNCSCVQGFTDKDCSVNISPFQINITKYEEIVYLEFDSKNISVEINLIDGVLSQSPNISYSWTCVECDGQNVIYNVESNRLVINNTLTDVTQAGNYTFIANASIANIGPFESRKSNLVQFRLIVKYDLNQPTLGTFGLPSFLVSGTQDQTISTVINSITLNQTTVRYFLGCVTNCSTLVSYSWQVKAGIFSYKKSGSVVAKYENNNLLSFSPSVPIQASIPTDYLNETVIFTFTVINSKQQNISSSVQIQIISSASPPSRVTVNNLIDVVPTQGISMNDKFTIKITEWVATTELLPLRYAVGYFDKSKSEPVRLSEYSLNTTISSYLPYIRSSNTKTRSILETTESIALVVFVKDALGNVETQTTGNVTVSPFNGTQEQYIEVVKSLSGESLLVASVDQTFSSTSASPSLISALISNVDIDPKNPSSSLSSLETLTSNNETLSPGAVSQVITKLDSFVSSLTDVYLSELALYGYVKSALSTSDVTKTVQIISNCFSTSYDSEKTKSTANNVTVLVYYGTIPAQVDSTSTQLPTTTYASSLINITVSSFNSPTPINNLQTVSDSNSNVAMNLTSIMSKYDAFSMTCGATMIVYSTNTNYDASVSNFTISSSVSDFKFMKKVDVLILENLDSPLILSFSASTIPSSVVSNSTITNSTYHCKYWDEKLKRWSSNGCKLYSVSSDSIKCACTHTTMFTTFLESKTTALTVQLKDQVSSLYYAQISFGIIYLVAASAILIGLIVLRKSQPVSSRLLTPYVGLIALIVECTLIYIVQRSVLVDQLNSANSQMWESGDTAANIIANIVMIIVNTLNLTAIFCYVMQVFRFQFMKLLYRKLSENRTQAQSTTVLKALKYATSQALFYSLIGIFAAVNVVYWIIWVVLRRTNVLSSTEYTYVVSVSYTVCILAFGLIITAVAILDLILSSKKEVDNKKNRRKAVNFSQPASTFSLDNAENINEKKKINKNLLLQAFHWFTSMDGPLYFRMEMFIYIISFILLILNQVIGLSSLSYRFETLSMFKIALTFDSISFIFEVLYVISYILVFGGYALIVAIIYKVRQSKTRKEEKSKQDEEIMNQELYNTLESGEGYELFANFCEKEFSSENLFLFSDIKAHQDVANGENIGGVLIFSEKIYSKYIKTGAEMEVNIPSKSRNAFIQLYEKCKKLETPNSSFELVDSGSLSKAGIETNTVKDCFDLMIRQVVMNLGDTFSRFVFTPEYLNFKAVRDAQLQIIEKANVVYGI